MNMYPVKSMSDEAENFPKHVAIIMDGNGRWARKRGLPRLLGHHKGAKTMEQTIRDAAEAGIRYLSVYAFSTENWKRSQTETTGLMRIMEQYIKRKTAELKERHGRLRFAGRRDRLPPSLAAAFEEAENHTRDETGIQVTSASITADGRRSSMPSKKFSKTAPKPGKSRRTC